MGGEERKKERKRKRRKLTSLLAVRIDKVSGSTGSESGHCVYRVSYNLCCALCTEWRKS